METGILIFLIVIGLLVLAGVVLLVLYLVARGKGKITLSLDKMEFTPGETVTGNINLIIKNPVEATSLNVGLLGTMRKTSYSRNSKGGMSKNTRTQTVFDFKKPVDGQKTYLGELNYPFKLTIPTDVYKQSTGNKVADSVIKSAQLLTGSSSRVDWFVTANLDMKGFDLKKKVRINIA